jgi:hypothetical protein
VQESAATLLRGGAEQGEEPGRSPGPPSRDTGERGTALGGGSLSRALSRGKARQGVARRSVSVTGCKQAVVFQRLHHVRYLFFLPCKLYHHVQTCQGYRLRYSEPSSDDPNSREAAWRKALKIEAEAIVHSD